MRNAMWVGGGITGMGEIPMLGVREKGFAKIMRDLFKNNEKGFWYDSNDLTEDKIKWRRNLLNETEFQNGISDAPSRGGSISAATFTGVSNKQTGLLISNTSNTVDAYAYKSFSGWKANVPYVLSVYLRMQDGSAPIIGTSGADTRADIGLVIKGSFARDFELHDLGGGLYRATATLTSSYTVGGAGVVKYKTFTARPVLVTGYQLEEGTKATTYQGITNFNAEFMARFPDHKLFQDSLGQVPIFAENQPVGLFLDRSKHLELGPELYTGALPFTVSRDASSTVNGPVTRLIAGKFYKVTLNVASSRGTMSASFRIQSQVTNFLSNTSLGLSTGKLEFVLAPTITGDASLIGAANGTDFTIDSYSIREIAGNHAYQTTSAARPILQQTPILASNLLPTYDFRTWSVTGAPSPVSANSFTTSATGGVKTDILKPNTSYILELDIENTSTVNIYHGASTNTAVMSGMRRKVLVKVTTDSGISFYLRNASAGTTTVYSVKVQEITGYRPDQSYLTFDGVDDKLITNLPAPLTNATVLRSVPGVGTQVKYNQTLPMLYEDSTNHVGLIAINRALTRSEQLRVMTELDKKAGATSLETLTFKAFDNNQEGFVYDPNDLNSLYQDAAGSVPVTAAGQPVGLMLDKHNGLMSGPNLATKTSVIGEGVGGLDFKTAIVSASLKIGSWYKVTVNVSNYSGTGDVGITGTNTAFPTSAIPTGIRSRSSNGLISFIALAQTSNSVVLYTRGANNADFTDITIQKIEGNHAYQATSASRPILRKNAATGANYLEFDGSDDFLQTSNINFTGTDKVSLFAGVGRLSSAVSSIYELGNTTSAATGSFHLRTSVSAYEFASKGALRTVVLSSSYPAPNTSIITAVGDVPNKVTSIRVNGTPARTNTGDQGASTYGNSLLHIGRRNGTADPFNGHLYSLIGIGKLTTDDETAAIEKELAKRTGVTLNV